MKTILALMMLTLAATTLTCNKGGLLCDEGQCHYPSYIEGCLTYAPNNTCAECEFNYAIMNGRCVYSVSGSGKACCLGFGSDGRCSRCEGGLMLGSSGLCEDIKIEGCLKKGQSSCQICASDYDLISGVCVLSVANCAQYNTNHQCTACSNNYQLSQGICVLNHQFPTLPNCLNYNQYGCTLCQQGYSLTSQLSCKPTIPGCLSLTSQGACQLCQQPYYQLSNGTCEVIGCTQYSQGVCSGCNSNLGFKVSQGVCVIENCLVFGKEGCALCSGNLVSGIWGCRQPEGKVCLICKSDEYKGSDGQCHKKDLRCVGYQNGRCIKCCEGYYLDSNYLCQIQQPGCIYQNGICSSCTAPFVYSNGQCLINGCIKYCQDGCIACDSRLQLNGNSCGLPHCKILSGYKCQQCQNGYQTNSEGKCQVVDPYCLTRNTYNICVKCKEGYQLDDSNRCTTLKWGCNYVDGRCTSCRSPFTYVPLRQACEIDGCLTYFVGGCEKCDSSYSLLYNTCKLPNCLVSKNRKCLECDPDYVFKSDGTCVSKDEYCEKMDQYGTCIKCMDTYYYSQKEDKCIKKSPGCKYDGQDNCIGCDAPFTYEPGRCVIKGCLRYQDKGCQQCQYPYELNSLKTCGISHCSSYSQDGHCASCQQGYSLSSDYLCKISDKYCAQFNEARTACLTCVKGYYINSDGICQYSDQHCSYFDSTGLCMNCDRLYFLNSFGKCQLRDPQCEVYTNGLCSTCRQYYFPSQGFCMSNMIGCKVQHSTGKCVQCDDDYSLTGSECVVKIKKLTWNSIDMDFFDDDNTCDKIKSKSVFTVGVNSKLNLMPTLSKGQTGIFYSSWGLNNASLLLSAQGSNGWSPSGSNPKGQYVGLKTTDMETFYACDLKQLTGSSLKTFTLQYSMDGVSFLKIDDFTVSGALGSISTFYFKPVYGQFIRLVVKEGIPNIRLEFYISSGQSHQTQEEESYIGKTVIATVDGVEQGGISNCSSDSLCWAGVESCEPRKIKGFSLIYNDQNSGSVSEVKIQYSTDGVKFQCFQECKGIVLKNGEYNFSSPLLAEKMHVHFSKYSGKPKFGIKFEYA